MLSALLSCVARNPRILRAKPAANLFMLRYLAKFKIRKVGGHVIAVRIIF